MGTENNIGTNNTVMCDGDESVRRNKELFEYEMTEVKMMLAGKFKRFTAKDMNNAGRADEIKPSDVTLTGKLPSAEGVSVSRQEPVNSNSYSDILSSHDNMSNVGRGRLTVKTADVKSVDAAITEFELKSESGSFGPDPIKQGKVVAGEVKIEDAEGFSVEPVNHGTVTQKTVGSTPSVTSIHEQTQNGTKKIKTEPIKDRTKVRVSAVKSADRTKLESEAIAANVSTEENFSVAEVDHGSASLGERKVDTTTTKVDGEIKKELNVRVSTNDTSLPTVGDVTVSAPNKTKVNAKVSAVRVKTADNTRLASSEIKTDVTLDGQIVISSNNIPKDTAVSAGEISISEFEDNVGEYTSDVKIKKTTVAVGTNGLQPAASKLVCAVAPKRVKATAPLKHITTGYVEMTARDLTDGSLTTVDDVPARTLNVNKSTDIPVSVTSVKAADTKKLSLDKRDDITGFKATPVVMPGDMVLENPDVTSNVRVRAVPRALAINYKPPSDVAVAVTTVSCDVDVTVPGADCMSYSFDAVNLDTSGVTMPEMSPPDDIIAELESIAEGCKAPTAMTYEEMCAKCDIKTPSIDYRSALSSIMDAFRTETSSNPN